MALQSRLFQNTLIIVIIIREEILRLVITAIDRYVLVNDISRSRHLVNPLSVGGITIYVVKYGLIATEVFGVVAIHTHLIIIKVILLCPEVGLLSELSGIKHLGVFLHQLSRENTTIFHLRFTRLAVLGRYQHDAVGRRSTIDGSCRRILQHLNTLDIVGVDRVQRVTVHASHIVISRCADAWRCRRVGLDRNAVDYIERGIATMRRCCPTDIDRDTRTRLSRALCSRHTRNATL